MEVPLFEEKEDQSGAEAHPETRSRYLNWWSGTVFALFAILAVVGWRLISHMEEQGVEVSDLVQVKTYLQGILAPA